LPESGVLYPQSAPQPIAKPDKVITLKKNAARQQIHRYTLQFETIKEKNEEEAHQLVKESLQRFLDIVLQADPKTIIPPFLELDRNDKSVSDLSAAFHLSSVDSYHVMKKYFF
jgi:N-acetyl-gamma-glutamylphosphate reductase